MHATGQPTDAPAQRRFQLTRYFSLTSLAGVLLTMLGLSWVYQHETQVRLIAHEEHANANLTAMFANTVWDRHHAIAHLRGADTPDTRESLLAQPGYAALREDVRKVMRGLSVVKVKLYNSRGVTIFSTDEKQVGELKRDNPGLQRALEGAMTSQLVHRDRMDTFEGTVTDVDLVSCYLPLRRPGQLDTVDAVVEVYSDVTEQVQAGRTAQWRVVSAVLAALAVLYLFLLVLVRRAARTIQLQQDEHAAQAAKISYQAFHDGLTDLPNRASFLKQLQALTAKGQSGTLALMYIDLDRFKPVNDQHGHAAGDALLCMAAQRMLQGLRRGDQVFRVGGDEFTALLPCVAQPEQAEVLAQRLVAKMAEPFEVLGETVYVGATIGLALFPVDGATPDELLRAADGAMYQAKVQGRGRFAFASTPARPAPQPQASARPIRIFCTSEVPS